MKESKYNSANKSFGKKAKHTNSLAPNPQLDPLISSFGGKIKSSQLETNCAVGLQNSGNLPNDKI